MGGGNAVGENGNEAKGARGTRREKKSGLVIFFQAEDGIRDIGVTGVQTCALPISVTPAVVYRWLGHPVVVGSVYLLFLGIIVIHGLLIWQNPLERVAALVVSGVIVMVTVHMVRRGDRKSVVKGKSVDLGGRRIIKK